MKILYLLDDLPYPADTGLRIKAFNLIHYMSSRHECHLLCFCHDEPEGRLAGLAREIPMVKVLGVHPTARRLGLHVRRIRRILQGYPAFLARWDSRAFRRAAERALLAHSYDVVHLEGLCMAPFVELCRGKPTVISTVDATSLGYERESQATRGVRAAYRGYAVRSIRRLEQETLTGATRAHVVSPADREYLAALAPKANIECIELAVPEDVLAYSPIGSPAESKHPVIAIPLNLFPASLRQALVDLLTQAWPAILDRFPDASVTVLGREAPAAFAREISLISGVTFKSWVQDFCAELAKAWAVIVPDLAGTGIKTRALYAMALGKPVVASPRAAGGIKAEEGVHCFKCGSPSHYVRTIVALLADRELRCKVGSAARALVVERYSPDAIGRRWEKLYNGAIASHHDLKRTAHAPELLRKANDSHLSRQPF